MADYAFNIAKGKIAEWTYRVNNNDPTNSALIWVPLSASGTEAQGQDFDTLALVLADANFTELTTGSWGRVTHTDSDIPADPAANDTDNRMESDSADVEFGTVTSGTTTGILLCYDSDTTSGTDTNIIPMIHFAFVATGVGTTVTATIPSTGFNWSV